MAIVSTELEVQDITTLPKRTASGIDPDTDFVLGVEENGVAYKADIEDLGQSIIQGAKSNLIGRNQTVASALMMLREETNEKIKESYGAPLVANQASDMKDKTRVYVYTGHESGYHHHGWYYWNNVAWTLGGEYNAGIVTTDVTLTLADMPADSKAVGDALDEVNTGLSSIADDVEQLQEDSSGYAASTSIAPEYSPSGIYAVGDYCMHDGTLYRCTTAIATAEAWNASHWTVNNVKNIADGLKDDLNSVSEVTRNLFFGGFSNGNIDASGIEYAQTNFLRCDEFIPVSASTDYALHVWTTSTFTQIVLVEYTSNKTVATRRGIVSSSSALTERVQSFTTGSTTAYIRFLLYSANDISTSGNKAQIELGTVATEYIYHDSAIDRFARGRFDSNGQLLGVNIEDNSLLINKTKGIFEYDYQYIFFADCVTGKYYADNGSVANASTSAIVPYAIPVKANKTYNYRGLYNRHCLFVDGSGNISFFSNSDTYVDGSITPSVDGKVYISIPYDSTTGIKNTAVFCDGELPEGRPEAGYNVSINNEKDVKANVITVSLDGTKDFTSIKDAIDSITDASKKNPYIIKIYEGTYDVKQYYTNEQWAVESTSFIGLSVPDYVTLEGVGDRDAIIITGSDTTKRNYISVLNLGNICCLKNLTIKSEMLRYAVHDDYSSNDSVGYRELENCVFIQENGFYAQAYGAGFHDNDTIIMKSCVCETDADDGFSISFHNNTDFINGSYLEFENCKFFQRGLNLNTIADGAKNNVLLKGTKSDSLVLDRRTSNTGIMYKVTGYANNITNVSVSIGNVSDYVDLQNDLNTLNDDITNIKDDFKQFQNDSSIIAFSEQYGNFWDFDKTDYGYYGVSEGGKLVKGGTLYKYCYRYVPVTPGSLIKFNTTRPTFVAYDAELNIIECVQAAWSGYTVPSGAKYVRMSIAASGENGFYCYIEGTSRVEYTTSAKYYMPTVITELPPIIVEYSGTGDYASLTQALYETDRDIVVMPGTYDLVSEYKALFGNDVFDTMTYQSEEINGLPTKGFQWGLYIDNRTVTFMSGASVLCDMSAYTNDATRRFSPFNLVRNAIIDGCYCTAINPYYIVHDDFGENTDPPFTNIIRNCILITPEAVGGNVIGGGCKKFSTKIVDNCYLDNGVNRPVTMRYHNTNVDGATPTVIIKNTRCNQRIRVNRYGSQTSSKMRAIINNCKATVIEIADEVSGAADNVSLYAWNNEVS